MHCKDIQFESQFAKILIEEHEDDAIIESLTQELHDQIMQVVAFNYDFNVQWSSALVDQMRYFMIPNIDEILDKWLRITGDQKLKQICEELGLVLPVTEFIDTDDIGVFFHQGLLFKLKNLNMGDIPVPERMLEILTMCGHLECLKYIEPQIYFEKTTEELTELAVIFGQLDCLKYLVDDVGCGISIDTVDLAWGRLNCLKYLYEKGCRWNSSNILKASEHRGNLDCLKYMCEIYVETQSLDDIYYCVLNNAIENGDLPMVKYLHEQKGRLTNVPERGYRGDSYEIGNAIRNDRTDILEYLVEQGFAYSEQCVNYAAEKGNLECIKYLLDLKCPFSKVAIESASYEGHLDCLKYLYEQGCPLTERAMLNAISKKHLECVKYLHEHGCPWHSDATMTSAMLGSFEILKYLHEHGCQWDHLTTRTAAKYGHLDCLRYAHEQGCHWTWKAMQYAKDNRQRECVEYLTSHGCPSKPP